MNKSSKPTTLALITTLLGFSFTASTVAQEETETPRRESRIQQQNRYFHPDDLRLNSEFSEYLGSPFLWNQRSEFSELTSPRQDFERTRDQFPQHLLTTQDEQLSQDDLRLNGEFSEYLFSEYLGLPFLWNQRSKFSELTSPRQDSERTHDQYPQYLLPTQDEQRLQSVRTEERLRTEEGLRSLQLETDQGQAFGEGIVLQTEQRQQKREVTIEPRQTRLELATGNAQTEYFQQEQTEGFVAPRDNSSLIEGGTIVQQETVRQIQVTEGHQIDGQRVIEDHKLIEDQRLVEGQSRTQGQRVFESTKRLQQPLQLERQVTKQRVETRVQLGAQEFRGAAIDKQTSRREIGILDTEKIVSVSPTYTSNRFEKEESRATVVAPVQNTRGPQTRGQAAQRAIAQGTTRHSQRESQKAGAWWMFLTIVPIFCWAAWRFISSSKTEEQATKTRSTTDQSTTRTLATSKTSKSQQRQSREFVEREVSDRQQTTRSEVDQTERKSRDRSEQTVRSETRTERPEREEQTTRSETDRTERKSSDRSERTVRSESRSESPEREEQTTRSETDRTERKSSDRSEQTVRSGSRSERPATSSRQQRELSREVEAEATDCELNAQQQERQGAEQQEQGRTRSPQLCDDNTGTTCGDTRSQTSGICESKNSQESKNGQARGSNCDDRNSSAGETNRETVASTAESRDDLTRIEGITEEAQRALYSSGYYRYSDLQNASKKQLKRVLAGYNLKFTDAQTKSWIVQSESLVSQGEISEQSVQQSQFNTSDSDTRASEEHVSRNASSQRDDLTKIRGIGKATSDLLSRSGITSYRDLYEAEPQRLRQLLDQAGPKFKLIDPSNWSQQAALAMNANSDGLKRWQPESAGASSTQCNHDYSSMEPDDLTAIRGIGPATQKILLEKGIHRFEQIASMKSEQFEELFAEYQDKFNLVDPSTWPEQAQSMLGNRISANEQEIEIMNEIQSIAQIAKEQPRETRQSDRTPQS